MLGTYSSMCLCAEDATGRLAEPWETAGHPSVGSSAGSWVWRILRGYTALSIETSRAIQDTATTKVYEQPA